MNINCPEIELALKISEDEGNSVSDISHDWSRLETVVSMNQPLTPVLMSKISEQLPILKYWKYKGSPHNSADEGFVCDKHDTAISFPIEK